MTEGMVYTYKDCASGEISSFENGRQLGDVRVIHNTFRFVKTIFRRGYFRKDQVFWSEYGRQSTG